MDNDFIDKAFMSGSVAKLKNSGAIVVIETKPITVSEAGSRGGKRSLETMTKEQRIIRAKNAVKARELKRKPIQTG